MNSQPRKLPQKAPLAAKLIAYSTVCPETGCWLWLKSTSRAGYGWVCGFKRGHLRAHRVSYETFVGPIPKGLFVCHHCDTPACINPEHLFVGTAQDNANDMIAKGRGNYTGRPTGENHGMAILREADIPVVIKLIKETTTPLKEIARQFKVSPATIVAIRSGRSWQAITGHDENNPMARDAMIARGLQRGPRTETAQKDVLKIARLLCSTGTSQRKIADRFNVHEGTVSHINYGRSWSRTTGASLTAPLRARRKANK